MSFISIAGNLSITCDNDLVSLYVNGEQVKGMKDTKTWGKTSTVALTSTVRSVAVECVDHGVIAGIIASSDSGLVTDGSWKCSSKYTKEW